MSEDKKKPTTYNPGSVDPALKGFSSRIQLQETKYQHREHQVMLFLPKLAYCADLVCASYTASLCLYSSESGAC